jgi:8-oxo-dGTP pyrophosphatase MutT (NUDIX family)
MNLRPRAELLCFKVDHVFCRFGDWVIFPGGGIDPGESAFAAARREMAEEADRMVNALTVAHMPTMQTWPADYAKKAKWSNGYAGGLTHWITGQLGGVVHADPKNRHADYEEGFAFFPIHDVKAKLHAELGGSWDSDVRVRLTILHAHEQALKTAGLRMEGI